MKKIFLLLFTTFVLFEVFAQENLDDVPKAESNSQIESNKWIISAGWNDVDIRTPDEFGEVLKDYAGFSDANMYAFPSKVSIERSLNKFFSMHIAASFAKIKKGYAWSDNDPESDTPFMGLDGKVKLNFLRFKNIWFDPFIETGFGVAEYDKEAMFNLKAGWGFNVWFAKNWGATFNSSYSHNFESSGNDYFQHSLGMSYRFDYPSSEDVVNTQALNETSKWLIGAGVNFLDVRVASKKFKDIAHDYFQGDIEDVNASGFPFRLTLERKFKNVFGLQVGFSLGDFVKPIDYSKTKLEDERYLDFDLKGTYDVNNLVGQTAWFDPFINLGIGYAKLAGEGAFKVNVGYGANFWLLENVGIKSESNYNHSFDDKGTDFFQYSAGLVYRFGGELPDKDEDGIIDENDECPEVYGVEEHNGCPEPEPEEVDTDEDGVLDQFDKCPDAKGESANQGCPWPDTDGDGTLDKDDNCPNEAGTSDNNGCPKVEEPEEVVEQQPVEVEKPDCTAYINEINSTVIYFDFDSFNLKPTEKAKLDRITELLETMKCSEQELTILSGYTDPVGAKDYNEKLSLRRAKAVRDYLNSKGVPNITESGYGEVNLASYENNALNRRVEVKVQEK